MGLLSILCTGNSASTARRRRRAFTPSLHPSTEILESRVVLSHVAADVAAVSDAVAAAFPLEASIRSIRFENLSYHPDTQTVTADGGTVMGQLGGLRFTTQIESFSLQHVSGDVTAQQATCAILHLELAPIHINLLGLHVDTSAICLNITAIEGGGLLGNLLCNIADSGNTRLLGSSLVTGGLGNILAGALNQAQQSPGDGSVCTGECPILDLALGPVDLTLLGLNVTLDNCAEPPGPVQICISASRGEGILGDLLCGLTDTPILTT